MARRHHNPGGEEDPGFVGVNQCGGDATRCAFYYYNGDNVNATLRLAKIGSPTDISLELSTDGRNWASGPILTSGFNILGVIPPGGYLFIRNSSTTPTRFSLYDSDFWNFDTVTEHDSTDINIGGNIKSLLCRNWNENIILSDFCFWRLFGLRKDQRHTIHEENHRISPVQWTFGTDDPNHIDFTMDFDVLYNYCYGEMFRECLFFHNTDSTYGSDFNLSGTMINSTTPGTIKNVLFLSGEISIGCFYRMFYGCTEYFRNNTNHDASWINMDGLTGFPTKDSFSGMFAGCYGLERAKQVIDGLDWYFNGLGPGGQDCMSGMFAGCINLEYFVFGNNQIVKYNGLYIQPDGDAGYDDMYMDIYESKQRVGSNAFGYMFGNCVSLLELWLPPYACVAGGSYSNMYIFCSSAQTLTYFHGNPILPAGIDYVTGAGDLITNTLPDHCYEYMFGYCSSLMEAPILPSQHNQSEACYSHMFSGCTNITYIKMLGDLDDTVDTGATYMWTSGLGNQGTFVMRGSSVGGNTQNLTGPSGIPTGWKTFNTYNEPFWIKNLGDTGQTVSLTATGSISSLKLYIFNENESIPASYSTYSTSISMIIPAKKRKFISAGSKLVKPTQANTYINNSESNYWRFSTSANPNKLAVGGNLVTLLAQDGIFFTEITESLCFFRLFYNFNAQYAQELNINTKPALTGGMLVNGGVNNVYKSLFLNSSLVYPPAHVGGTFNNMGSTNQYTFRSAFSNIPALRETPILSAPNVKLQQYYNMFYLSSGTGSIKKAFALFTNTPANSTSYNYGTYRWMYKQSQPGTFHLAHNSSWTLSGDSGTGSLTPVRDVHRDYFINHDPNKIYYLENRREILNVVT